MAQTLLAIVLVLAAAHALPDLARLRDFSWLKRWLAQWSGANGTPTPWLLPLIVLVVCALIQTALAQVLFGLPALAFGVFVLFYSWGPRDLDADIEAVLKAPDSDRRHAAAQGLRPVPSAEPLPLQSTPLVEAVFASGLSRWFGVLFWFVILGPAGALAYRVVQLLARHPAFTAEIDAERRALFERAALILDWAPSHLVALTLALATEFDAVIKTWRDYHAAHGQGYFTLDLGFLGALARAGIDADVIAGDGYATDVDDPMVELADARTVLRRILYVWVALIALCVLAGWAG
ncbi:beta-lactamase induction protein [Dokdonella sp.]|uniref:beta-lactamase induction protein n=1 Tax=Dokdonella sp. TaxID=2291710 RepID=UPI001B29D918|nr:beta-lactamase induction protein [Dokdonella sp.]MBO9664368.1 beta-lactamase induction protein [Dokdonella sp.]